MNITGASKEVAVSYLEAEEGYLDDAVASYLGDWDYEEAIDYEEGFQDCYCDGENVDPLDTYYD